MLTRLGLRNFALVEEMHMDFTTGVTVITGETGAGKSILINALSILLGERASAEFVRYGTDRFIIDGVFDIAGQTEIIALLQSKNIDVDDDMLYLSRSFTAAGKSIILMNNQAVPVKILRELGPYLADIHGQYSNQVLLDSKTHAHFLDSFTKEGWLTFVAYEEAYKKYSKSKKAIEDLELASTERERELDMLRFQLAELEAASLQVGEDVVIAEELQRLDNYEHLRTVTQGAYTALYDGRTPILEAVNAIKTALHEAIPFDKELKDISELLDSAYFQLEEVAYSLSTYIDDNTFDEERHIYCRERDSLLYNLKKKYGETIESMLVYEKRAQERLVSLESQTIERERLEEELRLFEEEANNKLAELQKVREKNNKIITQALQKELSALGMEKSNLTFRIDPPRSLTALGAESIELLFTPNVGEGARPLSKIVSGGELSRIALAFTSLFNSESTSTIVFDEIDVGISGNVAIKVAEKIAALGINRQILCITHMPQTACVADTHYQLYKDEQAGRTTTKLKELSSVEHKEYIASMISGKQKSEATLLAVEELIKQVKVV